MKLSFLFDIYRFNKGYVDVQLRVLTIVRSDQLNSGVR